MIYQLVNLGLEIMVTRETDHKLLTGSAALSLIYSVSLNRGPVHEKLV
jgi:hypothetical protein